MLKCHLPLEINSTQFYFIKDISLGHFCQDHFSQNWIFLFHLWSFLSAAGPPGELGVGLGINDNRHHIDSVRNGMK